MCRAAVVFSAILSCLALAADGWSADWSVSEKVSPVDDSKSVSAHLESYDSSTTSSATLLMVCVKDNGPSLYVSVDFPVEELTPRVITRVGKDKARHRLWIRTDQQEIVWGHDVRLDEFRNNERFLIRFEDEMADFFFNLSNVREVISTVTSACPHKRGQ